MPTCRRAILILPPRLLAVGSFTLALDGGQLPVQPADVPFAPCWATREWRRLSELRLPRAIAGFACGGLLRPGGRADAGAAAQSAGRPYVLGISGGAGSGPCSPS